MVVRVCIDLVFVSHLLNSAHFHRIIALYANLKLNPVWLFPVQLEYVHICEECTFSKTKNRNQGWGHIRFSFKHIIFVFQIHMCFVKKKFILIHLIEIMLYQLQSVRNVENVYSKLLYQTVTKVYFQVDQIHTILNLVCSFYLPKYEHKLQECGLNTNTYLTPNPVQCTNK